MMRASLGALAFALALIVVTPPALAQGDLEERREAAAALADSAFDLLQQGQFKQAAEQFRKADEQFHSPMFVLFQADAEEKQGNLIEARELLEKIIDEELAEYAPSSFREAQTKAQKRAAALDERTPTVTITVSGATSGPWTVTLDGERLPPRHLSQPVALNPGKHQVKVETDDGRSDSRDVELSEGDRSSVELVLVSTDPGVDPDGGDDAGGGISWVWPTVAYGVGGVGLIMGVVAGAMFVGKQSDLKDACENDGDGDPNSCPPDKEADGDDTLLLGNLSTAGFVIAGIGAVVGTVLLVVPLGEDEETDVEASVRPSLHIGPGSLTLQGRF